MRSQRTPVPGFSLALLLLLLLTAAPPSSWAYDTDVAHVLVDYSASAYFCRTPACSTWACTSCKKHPNAEVVRIHDDGHNGNGLVAIDPDLDLIIVAFAGTDSHSIPNWIDDLDAILTPYPDPNCGSCSVHLGIWQTYMAMRDQFMAAFDAARDKAPTARVWVTGHSLGAALAVHATLDLLNNRTMDVDHLVNFGQPRIGNAEFSYFVGDVFAAWGLQHYRVTHARDPVPHLPPLAFGFHHQPKEVFYPGDEEGGFSVCDDSGEDAACSDQYHVYGSIHDHMVYLGTDFGKAEEAGLAMTAEIMANGTSTTGGAMASFSLRGAVLAVQ